jgi:ketosteroid isomerase-like protein
MSEAQNTKIVQEAYAAFGRRDIAGILATMDDAVVWRPAYGAATHLPFAGERRGKAAVGEFFRIIAEVQDFEVFEPREFVAQGDKVITLGHYTAKVKATGRRFDSDFVMVFTLRNGKLIHFQEFLDTASLNAAF